MVPELHAEPAIGAVGTDARDRAERAILLIFVLARLGHVVANGMCTATAWKSYRRPRLAAAAALAMAAEGVLLTRRCWKRQRFDDETDAWIDIAVGIGGLLALAAATDLEGRTTWANWACPHTFTTLGASALGL